MMASSAEVLPLLATHRALAHAPVIEHEWLVAHGQLVRTNVGEVLTRKGEQAKALMILFEGRVAIRGDRGAGAHKIFEWRAGDCGGVMPYSRGASPPADAVIEEAATMLLIDREQLQELTRACPTVTAALVHAMLDRARMFTSSDLRDEKLVSLGKLAAGLAHELNNPASAVARSAKLLTESLEASEDSARVLGAARLSDGQLATIDRIRAMCLRAAPTMMRSVVGRSDREDEIAEWLLDHDADERCAGPLAETGITIEAIEELAETVDKSVLNATLKWMAAGCNVRALASEIETAAGRINDLVRSVKGFTYMDQARTVEPIDIRHGILDTLTMLTAKMRARNVDVMLDLADDLPRTPAVGAELNQVWMNLIDNALDAAPPNSIVHVTAAREMDRVVVRITDTGTGIPESNVGRIFDPFFTTKGVGKGTGLGLDIVRRLVHQAEGEITVESEPGRTEFQVRLGLVTS